MKKASVSLGHAIDVAQVERLKLRLNNALEKDLPVVLISDKVERADTAGFQLIYAFIHELEQNGHKVSWQKPSQQLLQISEILGMSQHLNLE